MNISSKEDIATPYIQASNVYTSDSVCMKGE